MDAGGKCANSHVKHENLQNLRIYHLILTIAIGEPIISRFLLGGGITYVEFALVSSI